MKKLIFTGAIFLLLISTTFAQTTAVTESGDEVILFKDGTYRKNSTPKIDNDLKLRIEQIGNECSANKKDIEQAYLLAVQGWRYSLPQPKSNQAAWGNTDGRTTWFYGYWKNTNTKEYSSTMPQLGKSGVWVGDKQNNKGYYRKGGSPRYPTKTERILSKLK